MILQRKDVLQFGRHADSASPTLEISAIKSLPGALQNRQGVFKVPGPTDFKLLNDEVLRRDDPRAFRCYSLKYRPRSLFHLVSRCASAAEKRACNILRSFSISSPVAPGRLSRIDCRNQRSAVPDSSTHWRNPSCAVRGNRTVFISAFTTSSRRSQGGRFLERLISSSSACLSFNAL